MGRHIERYHLVTCLPTHSIGVNRLVTGNTMTKLLKNAGIYVLCNRDNGRCYVGKDTKLGRRAKEHLSLKSPQCPAIYNAIDTHSVDAFDVVLIPYPNISDAALNEVEKWKIRQLRSHYSQGGYNLTWGGDGLDSETASKVARKTNRKRVEEGTHHFLGETNPVHKQMEEGTHPFFTGEINRGRVADGTHNFLGGELQRKRVEEGTHNFQDSEFKSKHSRENNRKRVEEGTHHFLDSEFKSKTQRKRVANGTHNLLRHNNPKARPEYDQVYWEFIISLPLGIKEVRKHLYEKFGNIPKKTIQWWVSKWHAELDNAKAELAERGAIARYKDGKR